MKIVINGKACDAEYGEYILEVARRNGIYIPTLCHNEALPGQGNCRLCMVEVIENKRSRVVASCVYPIKKEIEVITDSEKIIKMQKTIIRLLLARAPRNMEINELGKKYGIVPHERLNSDISDDCILCGLCVKACDEVGVSAISTVNRGITKKVSTPYDEPSSACIGCGACASVCPTNAIKIGDNNGIRSIWHRDFNMQRCQKCGEYFATEEQLKYIKNKLKADSIEFLCENCRRKISSEKMKYIYENVKG